MKLGQNIIALLLAVVVALVLGACVPQPYSVSTYNGVAHDAQGRVWLTGTTTQYQGGAPVGTGTWVQVCTQDAQSSAPKLLCQRVQVVDTSAKPAAAASRPSAQEKDDGGDDDEEDGEEEDEDKAEPPKTKGHPLDPNRKPVDEDL